MNESLQCPSVKELLSAYRSRKVFFEPMGGNYGDRLIRLGSMEVFKILGIELVKDPSKAECIVINGGGGMTPLWNYGFQILESYSKDFPHTPLIVLPSSWDVRAVDCASLLKDHRAPIYLYAREPYSFAFLKKIKFADAVRVGLEHDMAFNLQGTLYLKKLTKRRAEKHLLIKQDLEGQKVFRHNYMCLLTEFMSYKTVTIDTITENYGVSKATAYRILNIYHNEVMIMPDRTQRVILPTKSMKEIINEVNIYKEVV